MRGLVGALVVAATAARRHAGCGGGDVRRGVVRRARARAGSTARGAPEFGGFAQRRAGAGGLRVRRTQCPCAAQLAGPRSAAPRDSDAVPDQRQLDLRRARRHARHPARDLALRRQAPHRTTNDGDGRPWRVFARDEDAQLIGGVFGRELHRARPARSDAQFGSDTRRQRPRRAPCTPINVARIAYCESRASTAAAVRAASTTAPTDAARSPRSSSSARASRSPTRPRPALNVGGPLLAGGWRKPSDGRSPTTPRDNAAVRAVRLEMAGRTRRDAASCDYHLPAPCPARRAVDAAGAGRHAGRRPRRSDRRRGRRRQRDRRGSAGSPSTARRRGAVIERARGRTIVLVADRQRVRRRRRHARGAAQLDRARTARSTRPSPTGGCARGSTAGARRASTCA